VSLPAGSAGRSPIIRIVATIRVGVGGWTYEPWRGVFFPKGLPQKEELSYMSQRLTSIEVNGTYYRAQSPATYQKWYDETPDGFVFSLKGPRYAMNRKDLGGAGDSVRNFLESGIRELKEKLGPINWQLEPSKKFDAVECEAFLNLLPPEFKHAIEVRNESFHCPEFVDLARRYGVAIVLAGDSAYPQIPDVTAPFVYIRLMGTTEEANGYPADRLDAWVQCAKAFATADERDVYLYLISGYKQANPATAVEIIRRLG
jgi:uncharacterized protein YecE (DUF72 family)